MPACDAWIICGDFNVTPDSTLIAALHRAGYEYATNNFKPFDWPLPMTEARYAVLSGNAAMAMGGAAAGCLHLTRCT